MNTGLNKESYSLSHLQQGMLYHSLSAPRSGVDIEQILCKIREPLNIEAFKAAWDRVIALHPILRTRFQWEGVGEPLQAVEPNVDLQVEYYNWRQMPSGVRGTRIEEALREDRLRDFKMNEASLMRLALFDFGETEYYFLWTFHHALLDGRSFRIVLRDLFEFYEAAIDHRAISLEQPRPYRAYIDWLRCQELSRAEKYWRKTLEGFTAPTQLGIARTPDNDSRIARDVCAEETKLSLALTSGLRTFADNHRLTLNTLIQGAWVILLHRYSSEDDVVFGAVRACRHWTNNGADSMVGLFINSLPVRVQISSDPPLLALLKDIRKKNLAMREFEHTPLTLIQQWINIPPGKTMFETLVVFENNSLNEALRSQGNKWQNREFIYRGQTNFPLTLLGYADPELLLRVEYDRRRFDQQTIKRMLGHLQTLLQDMILKADMPASKLSYLTADERKQIMVEWNDTTVDYPPHTCLHQLFEAQVERTPDSVALVLEEKQLTYKELNRKANQLAYYLRGLGVGPDTLVGICAERSLEMVIGLFGILKAGGAYVALDPAYPPDRLAFMLEDARPPVILIQQKLTEILPPHDAQVVLLDTLVSKSDLPSVYEENYSMSNKNPDCITKADNLAYAIFTSGSTGRPKGVMISHRAICNRLLWMQDEFRLTTSDAILQKTPYSFDVSVWEFFWPLLNGSRLVVARPEGHKDNAYLITVIREHQITTLHFVPSMLQFFLEEQGVETCDSLKRVICSGEVLPYELQERFCARLKAELYNLYGPTEAAVDVTYWKCQRDGAQHIVPIGRPIANSTIYLLDRYMQPVPIGILGELYIGGVQVARGYLKRPELTEEKFIPNPFCDDPQARLYKTGDLCRYLPGGSIEYVGRNDFQVKIRGFRIEIGEIEAVLSQHPAVHETVVLAREDTPGEKRLVAYIVPKELSPDIDELRSFLKKKLPDYMIPTAYIMLDVFPLTFNDKVDRRALPEPQLERQTGTVYVPPQNEAEKIIVSIWRELLKIKKVGVNDNFFDLGGHSLLLVRMQTKLRESFVEEIPITEMFRYPTIKMLAGFFTQDHNKEASFKQVHDRRQKQRDTLIRQRKLNVSRRNIDE